ncbi:MAG: hypothetical protein P8165_16985 [Deltaproteobacteria bacterium]
MALEYPKEEVSVLEKEEIQDQLKRILNSPDFHATEAQRQFFQFVVSETLFQRSHEIKGYTVGTRVFGRPADFDPNTDPIVSIQANQLRRALERYYLTDGKNDLIRIDIPKGTYVPLFQRQVDVDTEVSGVNKKLPLPGDSPWPTILIRPFQNLTGNSDKDFIGIGLATDLAVEIARFQEIRVLIQKPENQEGMSAHHFARFFLDGNIREGRTGIRVAVYLTDTATGQQIWGDVHHCGEEACCLIEFQDEVAKAVAAKVTGEHGVICRVLSLESKNKPPSEMKTYEALLRHYEYQESYCQQSFMREFEALEHAAKTDPKCGQIWTALGRIYANIYGLGIPGFENPLEKAMEFARRRVHLNPDNQRAVTVLAYVLMLAGDCSAALEQTERAILLNPNSIFMLDGLGYLLTLLGDWERGPKLIDKVKQLNPYYSPYVHYALWVDFLRPGDYEKADLETGNFRSPAMFWEPLMTGAVLGLLERIDEGQAAGKKLLKLKPDFSNEGRVLIGHYIKHADILERTIEGLRKSGIEVQ